MQSNTHKDYEEWLDELDALAAAVDLELNRDRYNYHTYFLRGWSPKSVVDDLYETVSGSD